MEFFNFNYSCCLPGWFMSSMFRLIIWDAELNFCLKAFDASTRNQCLELTTSSVKLPDFGVSPIANIGEKKALNEEIPGGKEWCRRRV